MSLEFYLECEDVSPLILLFIDQEIEDEAKEQAVEVHIGQCPNCHSYYQIELQAVTQLKNLLNAVCRELPGASLHQEILNQTQALFDQMNKMPAPTTTFQFTSETTIFSTDGVSFHHIQIEHTEIHIEDNE
jgi:hypothetical protein